MITKSTASRPATIKAFFQFFIVRIDLSMANLIAESVKKAQLGFKRVKKQYEAEKTILKNQSTPIFTRSINLRA